LVIKNRFVAMHGHMNIKFVRHDDIGCPHRRLYEKADICLLHRITRPHIYKIYAYLVFCRNQRTSQRLGEDPPTVRIQGQIN